MSSSRRRYNIVEARFIIDNHSDTAILVT